MPASTGAAGWYQRDSGRARGPQHANSLCKKNRQISQVLLTASDKPRGDFSMTPATMAATSGLLAQSIALQASAHNVANMNTDGFNKQRVSMVAGANGVGRVSVQEINSPDVLMLQSGLDGLLLQSSNVSLIEESIVRLTATRVYQANLVVIEAEAERLESLLRAVA
ncbi:MAG TPA: hypothetical protein DIU15_08795 [Deltaproteobacteria bacterium]|nr:hypothetical protein [Deltaproteobacteria bacterium]